MSASKRKTERGDSRGGKFLLLPHCLLASEAFRTASPRAIKVLLALCMKHDGFNNGKIGVSFRELATLIDSGNNVANSNALCELMERGIVALARSYPKGQRLANEYRLTFVPMGETPATNEYLSWKVGDAGTLRKAPGGNFRASITETRTALRVSMAETGEETSRFDGRNASDAKPPILKVSPVSVADAHIVQPSDGLSASALKSPSNARAPLSAAPEPEGLRERVLAVLDNSVRGSQGQLAAMAAVRPAALSKFLSGAGTLNDHARIRLTCALPKLCREPMADAAHG